MDKIDTVEEHTDKLLNGDISPQNLKEYAIEIAEHIKMKFKVSIATGLVQRDWNVQMLFQSTRKEPKIISYLKTGVSD